MRTDLRTAESEAATAETNSSLALVLSAIVFLVVLLVINHSLFTTPIYEYTDFAANALQVERAKHFRELLGNYSRWGFHHPGPAFFYLYASGEKVLHDWLHLVPAEMNAHILCIILLNTAFLFGTIAIVSKHCRSRLFPPAAVAVSLFFIYVVNRSIPGSAVLSIWPPHAIMFCFLFFLACCAAVATGAVKRLPWLVFSGLLLIHGHVAQPLFVGTLGVCALATLWWKFGRAIGMRELIRRSRTQLFVSVALIVVFAFPVLLDIALHKDNNVRAVLHHASLHPGFQQPWGKSLKYECSFLAFIPDPEVVLQSPSARLISRGASRPYVIVYWCIAGLLFLAALELCLRSREKLPAFFSYSIFEVVLVSVLFYYWTLKMTGALFNFNGYFFFSIQLFGLFVLLTFILDRLPLNSRPAVATAACVLLPLAMFAAPKAYTNTEKGEVETDRLVKHLPPNDGTVYHLTFDQADWMIEAGVASRMKHAHEPFCVDDLWGFIFGRDSLCRQFTGTKDLILTHTPRACVGECQVLMKDDKFELQVEPYPDLKVPFTIKPDDITSLNKGFNEFLGTQGPVWSKGLATIYFDLAPDFTTASRVKVRIFGKANPDRPARILLNGNLLGEVQPGHDVTEFDVDKTAFAVGENRLVIQVDNPLQVTGDPQNDPRVLGFSFLKAEFEPL
jgi:hypothetical protein